MSIILEAVENPSSIGVVKHIDLNDTLPNGNNGLHLACLNGHYDTALKLKELGLRIDSTNKSGQTPADLAKAALTIAQLDNIAEKKYLKRLAKICDRFAVSA